MHTYIHRALSLREILSLRRSRPHEGRPLGEWHAAEDATLDFGLAFSWAPTRSFDLFDEHNNKVGCVFLCVFVYLCVYIHI